MAKPLCIDLYCGLGGWAEGFLAEGWDVVGFDIERHDYGTGSYPAQLVLQDVLTLHGSQFRKVDCIVASSPCQFFSRMAMPFKMPWTEEEFEKRRELALALFRACARIQREATEAAGRHIPMIQENVVGAQKWVGRSRFAYGSFHLWGDVPALMPAPQAKKNGHLGGGSWFGISATNTTLGMNPDGRKIAHGRDGRIDIDLRLPVTEIGTGVKVPSESGRRTHVGKGACGSEGIKFGGGWWNDSTNNLIRKASSRSNARKMASAQIAKIPFPLASHIARVFHP